MLDWGFVEDTWPRDVQDPIIKVRGYIVVSYCDTTRDKPLYSVTSERRKSEVKMALELFTKQFMNTASTWYKRAVAKDLNKLGEFEDCESGAC
jgi:hypothetical protein